MAMLNNQMVIKKWLWSDIKTRRWARPSSPGWSRAEISATTAFRFAVKVTQKLQKFKQI